MKQAHTRTTRVRFLETSEGALSGLVVEAPANHPLHQLVGTLIADLGLCIVWRETRLGDRGVQRLQLANAEGGHIPAGARLRLQQRLVSCV